ncbi:hypothetical protein [Helicobacter labetoulli]|uniref:hypothetical protein n=1 Tax=Helicobacter labetoulli TaxID=2315333 RepID=UPI000EF65911|nr:hypothetical protein [Helicobacter labetoulli]
MKNQKVKNISYLCKAEFALANIEKKELVALPSGAEVVSVNLKITKARAGGTVSIGLDDEANVFLNNSATTKSFAQSATLLTLKDNGVITAKITGCDGVSEDTKGVLRVLYFLPSEILVEY